MTVWQADLVKDDISHEVPEEGCIIDHVCLVSRQSQEHGCVFGSCFASECF